MAKKYNPLDDLHEWVDTRQFAPPKESGVYCIYSVCISVFGVECNLIYIGSTCNLKRRLRESHHVLSDLQDKGGIRITYKICNDYRQMEKEAIARFSPLANIHHQSKD